MCAYRQYLSEERDLSFNFGSDIPQDANISEIFGELTRRLDTKFDINKGLLVIRDQNENSFLAIATWNNGELLDGLSILLPQDSSLFEKVADDGYQFTDSYIGIFSGNFFEKKLLLTQQSKSYLLHPLKHEGQVVGMIGYSSNEELAFSVFEEGILSEFSQKFAQRISENN